MNISIPKDLSNRAALGSIIGRLVAGGTDIDLACRLAGMTFSEFLFEQLLLPDSEADVFTRPQTEFLHRNRN